MALSVCAISQTTLQPSRKLPPHRFLAGHDNRRRSPLTLHCPCTGKKKQSGAELATELSSEVERIRTEKKRKEVTMRKSRAILFSEICENFGVKEEEMRKRWRTMDEGEKAGFVGEFVAEWSVEFHPLSAKSVKEMVEEYLHEEEEVERSSGSDSVSPSIFPGLKRFMGFSEDVL